MSADRGPTMDERRRALATAPCPCSSGKVTRDCHENLLRPPSEEEFFAPIERGLDAVPHLRGLIPTGFPRSGRAKLTYQQAMCFEEIRTDRHWHHVNLPLLLHLAGNDSSVPGGRVFALELLGLLEAFAKRFHGFPGAKRTLAPLWQQAWNAEDPCFWSVVASCHCALKWPADVFGFERSTGKDGTSADLVLQTATGRLFVEIEIWHQPGATSAEELEAVLRRRFEEKAQKKFPRFCAPEMGVILQFAFLDEVGLRLLHDHPELLEPVDISVDARWVGQLIAMAEARNETGSLRRPAFLDFNTPIRSPPPPS